MIIRLAAVAIGARVPVRTRTKTQGVVQIARGALHRHASQHGRQTQSNRHQPTGTVHRSLRANGLHTSASTQSETGRAQEPTTTRVSFRTSGGLNVSVHEVRNMLCPCSASTNLSRGSKNQVVRILWLPDCHTRPMKR